MLPFLTTQMDFVGIMLSKISHTEKDMVWSFFYAESKKK